MNVTKICVIHLNQIGDLVFSLPLLRALRSNFPNATIHSVIKPYLQDLLVNSPDVDEIILREHSIINRLRLFKKLRKNTYDLLISLSESEECLLLTALSKARTKVGFSHFPWDFCLDIKEDVEGHHGWYNNRKLLQRLNIKVTKDDYVGLLTPLLEEGDSRTVLKAEGFDCPDKFVMVAPGTSARRRIKEWEDEKFAELIVRLNERYNITPLLVGGDDNRTMNARIAALVREMDGGKDLQIVNLTGEIDLKILCLFVKSATLFVGIDAGLLHLASSMDIPVVGIFGPTDPFYVGPQNDRSIVVTANELECVPCYLDGCQARDCMKRIDVSAVLKACGRVLN